MTSSIVQDSMNGNCCVQAFCLFLAACGTWLQPVDMCRHVPHRSHTMSSSSGRSDSRQGLAGSSVTSGDMYQKDSGVSADSGTGFTERMSLPHLPLGIRDWELNLDALTVSCQIWILNLKGVLACVSATKAALCSDGLRA